MSGIATLLEVVILFIERGEESKIEIIDVRVWSYRRGDEGLLIYVLHGMLFGLRAKSTLFSLFLSNFKTLISLYSYINNEIML